MSLKPVNTLLEVDRGRFRLRLWKRGTTTTKFTVAKTYGVAIGMVGYRTPPGFYVIEKKGKNVDWYMPHSPWVAPELQGTVIPGGDPRNPIKARWMEIHDGVGIHGTDDEGSIGTRASHGCIRMLIPDVVELYDWVPRGTPIYIV